MERSHSVPSHEDEARPRARDHSTTNSDLVFITDEDADRGSRHAALLQARGINARAIHSLEAAVDRCAFAVVLVSTLPVSGGKGLAERVRLKCPDSPVIMLAQDGSVDDAVAAMRAGVYDYVSLPVDPDVFAARVRRAIEHARISAHIVRASERSTTSRLIGSSAVMTTLQGLIVRVAASEAAVLVQGETGTGKELVARALHEGSTRSKKPFVGINCAAVPSTLLESELFGHVRGAYTDAKTAREGIFVQATGGTLFLDEIGDMTLEMQAKLLRALQEHCVRPVGGNVDVAFDTRVISATHHDLEAMVAQGRFREDLYYRINVITIELPPLRDRGRDIIEIAVQIMNHAAERVGHPPVQLSPDVAERLLAYDWPGNVRELENCIERVVALARTPLIQVEDLPDRIRNHRSHSVVNVDDARDIVSLDVFEERYIHHVIQLLGGNKSAAADMLGIDRRTLYRRLEKKHRQPPALRLARE